MKVIYNKQLTALLVIDPYNDFISEGGKLWDRLKGVAERSGRRVIDDESESLCSEYVASPECCAEG